MEDTRKELKVSAIENGTVIDHISYGQVMNVMKILYLNDFEDHIYIGANLESKKYGKKGIIKVRNKYFKDHEINKIALISPKATLIEIKNYKVTKKKKVEIPNKITSFVKCFNPNCITNKQNVDTKFTVIDKENLKLHCHYCEKNTSKNTIDFR